MSLFEEFIEENVSDYSAEIKQIMSRLIQIGKVTGFRDHYFKEEGDSNFVYRHGKSFWALFDDEEKKLRLYCISISNVVLILGGGGYKSKSVMKWQDDPILSEKVREFMNYGDSIFNQIDAKDIYWSENSEYLTGNLKNYEDE
ncbi:MAG: hypothetical protein IPO62_12625 [Saprospiraceae bacterium]|nr:hypothetical protein [Saprospiraceae bacterium]MBK9631886.1 hypothetical protein [Saprospiraceae bacterium]